MRGRRIAVMTPLAAFAFVVVTQAQAPLVPPVAVAERFEVVAIKPGDPDGPRLGLQVRQGGALELMNMPITLLIERAYGLHSYQIAGGPSWMQEQTFSVRARAAGEPNAAQVNVMIRTLLTERFAFSSHSEQRPQPAWILTTARRDGRLGPNLRPRQPPCKPGSNVTDAEGRTVRCGPQRMGGTSLEGIGLTMAQLAELMSGLWLNAPVVDRTGLAGQYDVTLSNVENQWGPRGPGVAVSSSDAVSVPVAVQEQLGLKIELGRAPLGVLVVDRVERPTFD